MLSPSKRRVSPSKSADSNTSNSRSPTKILSTLRTLIWSPSKENTLRENEDMNPTPSKKQRTELNSFITSSPQRQMQRVSPSSTPNKKSVRNLAADFEEHERKEAEKDALLTDSSLQNFVNEHFGEDKENFLQPGLAPSKTPSTKSLLNTLFSPMFKQYSTFFGGNSIQESGNITITEKGAFKLIELGSSTKEEEDDDDDALNKTICYDEDTLNESTTSEESEHGSSLQIQVLTGLSSNETLHDYHFSRETRTIVSTENSEITCVVEQESYDEGEEDDLEVFDPYLFIATLPPLPLEYKERPVALPAKTDAHPKLTLVLDLDETLVHCSTEPMKGAELIFPVVFNDMEYQVYVRKRPYFEQFLEAVSKHFEVVVFTASQEVYASKLLDIIDSKHKHIHHRLYRQSCVHVDGNYLKDLSILGRDLSQVVIVDNSPQTFAYQLDNGIPIESWFDDPADEELSKLLPFLFKLKNVDDVRPHVRAHFKLHEKIEHAVRNNKKQ